MSLILDALNRSRTEQGEVPNIETRHGGGAESGVQRRWPLLLALAAALLVIIVLLVDRIGSDAPAPAPVAVEPATPKPLRPEQMVPAPTPVAEAADQPEPASERAPVDRTQRLPAMARSAPAAPAAANSEVSALYAQQDEAGREAPPTPAPVTAPAVTERQPEPAPRVAEQAVDIEAMLRQAESELENARLEEHPAPFLEALSQQAKDAIPTIYYQRHDYSGNAGQSRVTLNGNELAKGDRANGIRVNEILADSVVLTHDGTTFRLRALNSWVNL